jgi:hypothetical protein
MEFVVLFNTPELFIESLNHFAKSLDQKYRYVNCGGCGVVALGLSKWMTPYVPVKIRVTTYEHESTDTNGHLLSLDRLRPIDRLSFTEWRGITTSHQLPSIVHLVVEFYIEGQRYIVDSTGVYEIDDNVDSFDGYPLLDGSFCIDEIDAFVKDQSIWNRAFKRSQIPKIKKDIKQFFSVHVYNGVKYVPLQKEPDPTPFDFEGLVLTNEVDVISHFSM